MAAKKAAFANSRVTPLNSASKLTREALGSSEKMPDVEQRTLQGGHQFRVRRGSGEGTWSPWTRLPEGARDDLEWVTPSARACMEELRKLDSRVVLALPSIDEAPLAITCEAQATPVKRNGRHLSLREIQRR